VTHFDRLPIAVEDAPDISAIRITVPVTSRPKSRAALENFSEDKPNFHHEIARDLVISAGSKIVSPT
jgi:hypothetical protein